MLVNVNVERKTVAEVAPPVGKTVADIKNCLQSALIAVEAKSMAEALHKAKLSD